MLFTSSYLKCSQCMFGSLRRRVHANPLITQASVAMSADGMELLALAEPDLLYYSIDSGERWASMNGLVEANVPWSGAAVSGNLQAAAKRGGSVYHNLNGGASGWKCSSSVLELPRRQWSSVALATIGPSNFTLAAAVAGGGIYVGTLDNIFCRPQGVGPVAGYRYIPVGEVATGTTGAQKWTGLALFPTGAMVAAAAGSPWGIYHSMDGRIWMPRTRWVCAGVALTQIAPKPAICATACSSPCSGAFYLLTLLKLSGPAPRPGAAASAGAYACRRTATCSKALSPSTTESLR